MLLGSISIGSIEEWEAPPGAAVSWRASPASCAKAAAAPVSDVPVSYMQAQHLRGFVDQRAKGLDYSRLVIVTCDVPGQCDIRAMTYVVNAHVRRHDTFRSWFEYRDECDIVRHTMTNPADIKFVPTRHGELTSGELRELTLSTPDPLHWDCFTYGIVQYPDRFTIYVSIDHLHMDATFAGVTLMEFHAMYTTLVGGGAPLALPEAGSYDAFCVRQKELLGSLTSDSPQVRAWADFATNNNGSLPDFPLPLGDPLQPCGAEVWVETIMDEDQTSAFEAMCVDAGARFIGGMLACIGLVEHELTGAETYYGLTPSDTRKTTADLMTMGWFTGLIPITVPISDRSFAEAAAAAQESFDAGRQLVDVPFYRVLELRDELTWPRPNFQVINFLDAGAAPLSVLLTTELESMRIGMFSDGVYSYQMTVFLVRLKDRTAVSVVYPNNPEAHESVGRYVKVLKSTCARVLENLGAGSRR